MPRTSRIALGGVIYHILNRANARSRIFSRDSDYSAFVKVVAESCAQTPMRVLAYCVMPNHWHMLLWPHHDGDLGDFMQRLTTTHARRWHAFRDSAGSGHVYQGPYKSFPVQDDDHFLTVARYIERNPVRAGLTRRAEEWKPSSIWQRRQTSPPDYAPPPAAWPVERPHNWTERVNRPEGDADLEAISKSLVRGQPFGSDEWRQTAARRLNLEHTLRTRGRPKKGISSFLR